MNSPPPSTKNKLQFTLGQVVLMFITVAGVLVAYYYYSQYSALSNASNMKAKRLVDEVGVLILLPDGETPTIATVSDPKALIGQPFFAHTETGDKVLVFSDTKKAILYRPSIHKIIEVMPFELPAQVKPVK